MSNRLAIVLVVLILAALTVDFQMYDSRYSLFLAQKLWWLIDYLAFWR